MVSYNDKHNEANGDENQDGTEENHSWNCGAEGPTDDPAITALRWQQQRNFLTTLVLSQGVPMLLAGDEFSHTQRGNNNPYCQDHELTWLNWQLTDGQRAWCDFVRAVIQVRRTQPVFRRRKFFQDRAIHGAGIQDISWFDATGQEMTEQDWQNGYVRCLGVRLAGDRIGGTDERSELVVGDTILLLMNAHYEVIPFLLPPLKEGQRWERVLDTAYGPGKTSPCEREQPYALQGRTMAVLRMTLQHDQVQHPLWTAAAEC